MGVSIRLENIGISIRPVTFNLIQTIFFPVIFYEPRVKHWNQLEAGSYYESIKNICTPNIGITEIRMSKVNVRDKPSSHPQAGKTETK